MNISINESSTKPIITNSILQRIENMCNKLAWSKYRLAKESHLPYSSVRNMFSRGSTPSIQNLEKICRGFGISVNEFLSCEELPDSSFLHFTKSFFSLSESNKILVLQYIDSLNSSENRTVAIAKENKIIS